MDVVEKNEEKAVKTRFLASKIPPETNQKVFSVIPPFSLVCFYPDIDRGGRNVLKQPSQFITISSLEGKKGDAKYSEVFKKLLKEGKIAEVGRIDKKLQVEISDKGFLHLQEMTRKYSW